MPKKPAKLVSPVKKVAPIKATAGTGFAVEDTPRELGNLAQKMVDAKTLEEGDRLQEELVNGFFGYAEGSA